MIRLATPDERDKWDQLILNNPDGGDPLQLMAFAETKKRHGWTPKFLIENEIAILALSRLVPGIGEYWYIPKGPGVTSLTQLKAVLKSIAKSEFKPFAVRIDPELKLSDAERAKLSQIGLVPAPRHIQYNVSTVAVSLKASDEAILAGFKQKTRYNVRLALKKGVEVDAVPTNAETIDVMYALTEAMTARAGVYLREKSYFSDFWSLHAESGHGQMFQAKFEGEVLAGAFITFVGKKALYKDGGSVRNHPEVQAPYALQWGIMQWLKAHGVEHYDLHGVPPADQIDNQNHPLAGLARFKTGFSNEVIEYMGTYDLPLDKLKYQAWRRLGERLAVAYEYRVKKRLFY